MQINYRWKEQKQQQQQSVARDALCTRYVNNGDDAGNVAHCSKPNGHIVTCTTLRERDVTRFAANPTHVSRLIRRAAAGYGRTLARPRSRSERTVRYNYSDAFSDGIATEQQQQQQQQRLGGSEVTQWRRRMSCRLLAGRRTCHSSTLECSMLAEYLLC
jgi:hypothetical protein